MVAEEGVRSTLTSSAPTDSSIADRPTTSPDSQHAADPSISTSVPAAGSAAPGDALFERKHRQSQWRQCQRVQLNLTTPADPAASVGAMIYQSMLLSLSLIHI